MKNLEDILKKIFYLTIITLSTTIYAQNIRPVMDNIGFIWKKESLTKLTNYLEKNNKIYNCDKELIAAVSPHDDYLYAGDVEYSVLKNITAKEVVIFGVTHRSPRKYLKNPKNKVIFESFDKWNGLSGTVEISSLREVLKNKLDKNLYLVDNKAHSLEHSIESIIPWLQDNNKNVKITPIMVTEMSFKNLDKISSEIAKIITTYIKENKLQLGKDIAFIASSDATHYGKDFKYTPYGNDELSHKKGTKGDKLVSKFYLERNFTGAKAGLLMQETKNKTKGWCGKYSVPFGLSVANKVTYNITNKVLVGKLVKYSDSYTSGVLPIHIEGAGITAPFSLEHWVGYLGVGYKLK